MKSVQESSREELLSKIEETARNYETKYHGCSRSVLRSLQEHLNLGDSSVFVASTPLAGGICMIGDTCGALLGGVLAVGLATGSQDFENEAALFASLAEGYRFYRKFVKKMGGARCRDIQLARLGYFVDLTNPEAYNKAKQAGLYDVCGKFAGETARLAAEHILGLQGK